MKKKEKAISPIIAIILLVVICVVLVTMVLNWGTNLTNTTLSSSNQIITQKDDITGFIFVKKATDRSILIQNTSNKDIVLKGYTIIDNQLKDARYLTRRITLNPEVEIKSGDMKILQIACFPSNSFKLNLYTIENKYIELQVSPSNYDFSYCERNDPNYTITSCPDGYITVPGNPNYNTSAFCVQQYEARLDNGFISNAGCEEGDELNMSTATLQHEPEISPLININMCAAKRICVNSGGHLITNNEWMTIARNIEQVEDNWTGGSQGVGVIKRGNIGRGSNLENYIIPEGGYMLESGFLFGGIIDFGENRNELAKLILSNGEEIWDFSGNLEEWVDLTIIESCDGDCNSGNDTGGVQHESPGFENLTEKDWYEFTDLTRSGLLTYNQIKPFNNYNSEQGVGKIYITPGKANSKYGYTSNVHGVVRGGTYFDDNAAGVFAMNFRWGPDYFSDSIGFRCAITLD